VGDIMKLIKKAMPALWAFAAVVTAFNGKELEALLLLVLSYLSEIVDNEGDN